MIAIYNKSKRNNNNETLYHIFINKDFICEFWHDRDKGLSECLKEASRVAEMTKLTSLAEIFKMGVENDM